MPWAYSWTMIPLSKSLSRSAPLLASLTLTGRFALKRSPSARLIITEGIVIVGSAPPMAVAPPGTLLTTMAAMAPAFCAFLTLSTKAQLPRSTSAIRPGVNPTSGSQASVVDAPVPSLPSSTVPVKPAVVRAEPKPALAAS